MPKKKPIEETLEAVVTYPHRNQEDNNSVIKCLDCKQIINQ